MSHEKHESNASVEIQTTGENVISLLREQPIPPSEIYDRPDRIKS